MKHYTDLAKIAKEKNYEIKKIYRWEIGEGEVIIVDDYWFGYLYDGDSRFGGWNFCILSEEGYCPLYADGWTEQSAKNNFPTINHEELIEMVYKIKELPETVKSKFKSLFE